MSSTSQYCQLRPEERMLMASMKLQDASARSMAEAKQMRELEAENAKLKHLLAEADLDMHALKSVLGAKG